MKIHMTSIGGSVMHNLALCLDANGHIITGSDDEIYEPSKSRLQEAGLLPIRFGWDEKNISKDLDLVILGMHAKSDNPEILRALELSIPIMSFPEFIASQSKNKKRVVVAGSHGKTSTTSMIMHVLQTEKTPFDYLVGAQLEGFDRMVQLSNAPIIVIEGDEYLSSALDSRPKMMHYNPDVAIITGIEWDHINVFPTLDSYKNAFAAFIVALDTSSKFFYSNMDGDLCKLVENSNTSAYGTGYHALPIDTHGNLVATERTYQFKIFGEHNYQNMNAARLVCRELGVSDASFYEAMESFRGASKRLQKISDKPIVFLDFAHAPSKVRATVKAVRAKFANLNIAVVLELHTYSSLNPEFLPMYKGVFDGIKQKAVFCNRKTLEIKRMRPITDNIISEAFGDDELNYFREKEELQGYLHEIRNSAEVILIMSSGHLGGIHLADFFEPNEDQC